MFMEGHFGKSPQSAGLEAKSKHHSARVLGGFPHKKEHAAGAVLLAEESLEGQGTPRILVSGWASRAQILPNGKCQIFGFLIPGDMICRAPATLSVPPARVVAVTPGITADIPANNFGESGVHSHFTAIEIAEGETYRLLHRQIVRLGHLSGVQRLADLLLEFQQRLSRAGFGHENSFPMPLTQEVLADALGMSMVHINRCMQQLRQRNVIGCSEGEVVVLDSNHLIALAHGTTEI